MCASEGSFIKSWYLTRILNLAGAGAAASSSSLGEFFYEMATEERKRADLIFQCLFASRGREREDREKGRARLTFETRVSFKFTLPTPS